MNREHFIFAIFSNVPSANIKRYQYTSRTCISRIKWPLANIKCHKFEYLAGKRITKFKNAWKKKTVYNILQMVVRDIRCILMISPCLVVTTFVYYFYNKIYCNKIGNVYIDELLFCYGYYAPQMQVFCLVDW